ncbi:hypothetical protein Glove_75g5 [Diversispora epigaea]|uniref:Transposase domain-containing protein n=1 Tax=Diversispora epigaea TaxID=1348612 RepID=A0A397JD99_9GLOM|nr:hypothetical protein Glove_75g5 [Diversispora epigaea]
MPPTSHEYEDVLENTDVVSNFSKNYDINQTSQSNFDQSDRFEESNMEDYYSFEQVSPDRFEESNIEDYDNFEQVSPEREENVMEFPNEAYADLMELFIKHDLNNKTGNAIIKFFDKHSNLSTSPLLKNIEAGRKLMDIMNVQKLPYSKHCILDYKNKEYFVYYRPIKSCIESLLSNPDIIKNFIYKYQFLQSDGETLYSEQYSGNWWKNAKASIRPEAHILSIILYSDATTTDSLGKSSLHLIYISLENIRTWRRNKEDAKQLLGYLPILSANNEGQTSRFKRLARETFHNSLKFLLDPLFDEDGIDFKINNKNIWFFPRISTVIGDWLEACTFSLTFKSANSNYPCHFCQTHRNDLTSIRKNCIIIRNKENMQEYYNNGSAESIGLEQVYNYFWTIPNIDIYAATVPDRMHHLDLGLFRYQIEYTKELLGKSLEDKMNRRIAIIPRHPGLKIFAKGVQSIARLTASEFRDLMKVMVFVVNNLLNKDLSEVYVRWNRMYLMSRFERFTESDLENFQEYYNNGSAESIGLEQVYNYFWTIPNIDIYAATVPDRMHHLDLGLFRYQIEYTKELLGKSLEDKMNRRIAIIPRHPGLKIFAKGVQSIARLTASEFRDLMKVMVFVVDNLLNKDLSEVYVRWNRMYLMSRFERFTESDLENFQIAINEWADLFIILFWDCSSGMKMPKLHSWIYHIVDAIRDFGAINRYTTETYESLHKTYVKIPYRLSNKKDVEMQIMKNVIEGYRINNLRKYYVYYDKMKVIEGYRYQ